MNQAEFHPEAEEELLVAARYYENQANNLGLEFISSVEATRDQICRYPESGSPFGARLRRFLVRRFPYALVYRAQKERLLILAVAHLRRRPGYWRNRL